MFPIKYLSSEPMVFGPPRTPPLKVRDTVICDHLGTKKIYVRGHWECEHCGLILISK